MESDVFLRKVAATIQEHALARPGAHILVAVSGGADSVALLCALTALAPRWDFRLTVWHLDHGLRGAEARHDGEFVRALATRLGHAVRIDEAEVGHGANLEQRARNVRYRGLERAATDAACTRAAVGHTQTDQAETLLLRLCRGAAGPGLGAMAPRRGGLIRPLIECTRAEVREFLHRHRLDWVEDSSNDDERFARNRLRRRVLPPLLAYGGPGLVARLARTATVLRDESRYLDCLAARTLARAAAHDALSGAAVRGLPVAMRRRVIRLWLGRARGGLRGVSAAHIDAIDRQLDAREHRRIDMPRGHVRIEAGRLSWDPVAVAPAAPFAHSIAPGEGLDRRDLGWALRLGRPRAWTATTAFPPDARRAVFDLDAVRGPLCIRSPRPGDRIQPFGMRGTRKLHDVFIDAKVPVSVRAGWPLLTTTDAVLWVPGLTRGTAACVHDATRTVVWAAWTQIGSTSMGIRNRGRVALLDPDGA